VTQTKEVPVRAGSRITVPVRGGTTLVIRNDGRVRYAIAKELHARRRKAQLDYAADRQEPSGSLYHGGFPGFDLQALHRGY
jgi:hypothetical protein